MPGMNEPMMEEAALREMLERATAVEPPIGPVARNAVRACSSYRCRRRPGGRRGRDPRRGRGGRPDCPGGHRDPLHPRSGHRHDPGDRLCREDPGGQGLVTPISTTTNQAGTPIGLGRSAATWPRRPRPTGRRFTSSRSSTNRVIPISTTTNTAGKRIRVGKEPDAIAITPDGRTAYVAGLGSGTVTPIATATNTPGPAIRVGRANAGLVAIAITPDGQTAYVVNDGTSPGTVVPISTATDRAGKPISVGVIRGRSRSLRTGRRPTSCLRAR